MGQTVHTVSTLPLYLPATQTLHVYDISKADKFNVIVPRVESEDPEIGVAAV